MLRLVLLHLQQSVCRVIPECLLLSTAVLHTSSTFDSLQRPIRHTPSSLFHCVSALLFAHELTTHPLTIPKTSNEPLRPLPVHKSYPATATCARQQQYCPQTLSTLLHSYWYPSSQRAGSAKPDQRRGKGQLQGCRSWHDRYRLIAMTSHTRSC